MKRKTSELATAGMGPHGSFPAMGTQKTSPDSNSLQDDSGGFEMSWSTTVKQEVETRKRTTAAFKREAASTDVQEVGQRYGAKQVQAWDQAPRYTVARRPRRHSGSPKQSKGKCVARTREE